MNRCAFLWEFVPLLCHTVYRTVPRRAMSCGQFHGPETPDTLQVTPSIHFSILGWGLGWGRWGDRGGSRGGPRNVPGIGGDHIWRGAGPINCTKDGGGPEMHQGHRLDMYILGPDGGFPPPHTP